jgi:hypothetical protein
MPPACATASSARLMGESIYRRALGAEFGRLHPQIQRRFGFSSDDGLASIGHGVMEQVWHGLPYTLPFLYVGTWRRIMFPEYGRNLPFTIENYAYRDPLGRETVTWLRTFRTRRVRRFDADMIYSERRGRIVDAVRTPTTRSSSVSRRSTAVPSCSSAPEATAVSTRILSSTARRGP